MNDSCLKIAIDGGAATGKTTVSKKLANRLNSLFVSSGIFYRFATIVALEKNLLENETELFNLLNSIDMEYVFGEENIKSKFSLDKNKLNSLEISNEVSSVSKMKKIRELATTFFKKIISQNCNLVIEGRDIGSVVMPNANFKFFLTVSLEEALKRRGAQLKNSEDLIKKIEMLKNTFNNTNEKFNYQDKENVLQTTFFLEKLLTPTDNKQWASAYLKNELNTDNIDEVLENIVNRNKIDSTRKIAPLIKSVNSIEIITDNKTPDEVVQEMISIIQNEK